MQLVQDPRLLFLQQIKEDKIIFAAADDGTNPNIKTLAGGTGIAAVVDDTTPQLGGNLDVNGNDIVINFKCKYRFKSKWKWCC